ncbi:hypothetical protein HBI56_053540 [Parastagonospora nodorum]|nr:hypothetical protein HBH56_098550 [Parastagonospora nodorum]KAH3930145.1 hypothetical protein HBH54_112870 [Parastagonospora nodorum]KAH3938960.1 hypothetical protein HBH53_241810 [Parastagonospora nodorum]KAH3964641.1 hypothetical protein HBH51_159160 [Parastagonospora nodorum]KAH3981229.1 hypothetical protein HBH52_086400 [Parastagonospora nodorum]
MAPALVPKIIKRQAKKLTNYVGARICHEYDEATLKGQTFMRLAKEFIHDSAPHKIYAGAGQISPSFHNIFAKELNYFRRSKVCIASMISQHYTNSIQQSIARGTTRGRVGKAIVLQLRVPTTRISDEEVERKRLWHESEQKDIAWQQAAPARAAQRAKAARAEAARAEAVRTAELRKSKAMMNTPSTYQDHRFKTDYMEEMRSAYPASENHMERSNRIQAGLASILGPERMGLGVGLPSGHSGIDNDPVLAKHNTDKRIQDTKDVYEQYQAMLRQQCEQQQHREAEEAAAQQSKQTELDAYRFMYKRRIEQLLALSPEFHTQAMGILQAYEQGNFHELQWALSEIISNVLEPACKIFEEMQGETMLELFGANELKNAWPLEAIDRIFTVFDEQAAAQFPENEQNGLGYMIRCIQFICKPIVTAREWIDPLMQQASSNLPFVAAPIPISFEQFAASVGAPPPPQQPQDFALLAQQPRQSLQHAHSYHQQPQVLQQAYNYQPVRSYQQPQVQQVQQVQPQVQQIQAPEQAADTGKNFDSFSDLLKASKANKEAQAPFIFSINPAAAQPTAPVASFLRPDKGTLMVYIDNNVLQFQVNVDDFLKEGRVNVTKCQENQAILKWMEDYVQDETGILGQKDNGVMKTEIMRMIVKLDALKNPKEKEKRLNKDIRGLAKKILKIWA